MYITCGNVVRGQNFFNRESLLEKIWEKLESDNILLAAPRRVGKTSLMFKIIDEPKTGFNPVFLDCQNFDSPENLAVSLITEIILKKHGPKVDFKKFFEKIQALEIWELRIELKDIIKERWQEECERILRNSLRDDEKLLIIIDELPLLLHKLVNQKDNDGIQKAENLLDWLRHIRTHKDFTQNIRMILGGSIGLPQIAKMMGSSHKINDLVSIEVSPLDRNQAKELAYQLFASRNVRIDDESMEALLEQIGTFIPFFIQIMVSCITDEVRDRKISITPQIITECYENRALGAEYRTSFDDYYQRLDRYYTPDEARIARRILKEMAIASGGVDKSSLHNWFLKEAGNLASDEQFESLMTWLKDDFYLVEITPGKFIFKLRWLKDWWRKYHA